MLSWIKFIILGVAFATGLSVAYGLTDMIIVKPLKAKVGELSVQLNSTIDTNEANDKICKNAIQTRDNNLQSYQKIISDSTKKCDELLSIYTLKGGKKNEINGIDPVLDMLNGLYGR